MFFVWLCLVVLRGTETKTEKKGLTEGSLSLSLSLCLSLSLSRRPKNPTVITACSLQRGHV